MTKRKADRRPERTRAQLHQALLELVVERTYEQITVKDILDRANIGRSTFYIHFRDKDELLLSGMPALRESLVRVVQHRGKYEDFAQSLVFVPELFGHAEFYRRAYTALSGRARLAADRQIFDLLHDLTRLDLRLHKMVGRASIPMEAASRCIAGALVGLISWWVEQASPLPPPDMGRLALALLQPTAASVVAPPVARTGGRA